MPVMRRDFFIPEEFMDSFRGTWDFKESDEMPFIHWDYSEVKRRRIRGALGDDFEERIQRTCLNG